MTQPEAYKVLHDHAYIFEHWKLTGNLPDFTSDGMQSIYNAYLVLNPGFVLDRCCSQCLGNMIEDANRHRVNNLKFYSFPK